MFGSKAFGWKLAGASALALGLGTWCAVRGRDLNPSLWRLAAQPERWSGQAVWIPAARVGEGDPDGFWIESDRARFRVLGRAAVRPGDEVSLTGRVNAAGPHLELDRLRVLPRRTKLRWAVEAVSLAVLGGVLFNFRRRFSFHPEAAQAERR
jgi:hypothetical protein